MRFGLRRSSLAAESIQTEPEPRRRNRLSKPLTGNAAKIQVSASAPAINLQGPAQSKNASTAELSSASPLSPTLSNALRQQIRTEMLAPINDSPSPTHTVKNDSSRSVAYMVGQIEEKTESNIRPQQQEALASLPLSPVKPRLRKRKSLLLRRLSMKRSSSLSRTSSFERTNDGVDLPATSTANTSVDRILADAPSIPPTRRASFAPGAATRKLNPITPNQDTQERKRVGEVGELNGSLVESEYFDWRPPPPITNGRAGTPSEMGYSQLGGLRHGSLQIVNGRASPAFSEVSKMSRQLLAVPVPHRDVSSEYGDAEEESEEASFLSHRSTSNDTKGRRVFSWEKDDDKLKPLAHQLQNVMNSQQETELTAAEDHTSRMAKEYIAEVGNSPFEQQRSDSPVGTIRRTRSEGSLWRRNSCSSLQGSPSFDPDLSELSPVSPIEQSLSPSGSVIRKTSSATSRSQRLQLQVATAVEHEACNSEVSWYSPIEPNMPSDEAFQSAVEFQVQLSPRKIGLQPPRAPEKSDSGYSSSNSLRSLQYSKGTPPPVEIEALPKVVDSVVSASTRGSSRPPSFLGLRPSILKSRRTEPNIPTLANLRPQAMPSNTTPVVIKVAAPEPESIVSIAMKARKKLVKKRRPQSLAPDQISVVRVQSIEQISIPQVPPEARENLRWRSQAVPELEKTYVMPNLQGAGPSLSNLDLSKELRFPSPAPAQEPIVKRSRSRSRPQSWFGRVKRDISSSRRSSGLSPLKAMTTINDFGTDGTVLGRSPYDLGDQVTLSQRSKAPSVISAVTFHSRPTIDDQNTVELSRQRSRSHRDRDSLVPERRPSFNDRGGIPGRSIRPASFTTETPPITPEMLAKAYRTSSMQRQSSMTTDVPPPPPLHSPRPRYLEYEDDEAAEIAPPPPSHSPRPIDITPEPWAAQAAAWEARRRSAGEALRRQSWDSRKYEQYREDVANESLYPTIPARQQPNWTQSLTPEKLSRPPQDYNQQYQRFSSHQEIYHPVPEASYEHSNEHDSAYVRQSRKQSMLHDTQYRRPSQSREPSRHRPLPSPRTSNGLSPSRPQSSANSVRSFASSMAEPLRMPSVDRSYPPPAFGRYSGGMSFGYERGNGFGGSAGTRSASGKADATRKGVPFRASYGVDLGDVPVGVMARC